MRVYAFKKIPSQQTFSGSPKDMILLTIKRQADKISLFL